MKNTKWQIGAFLFVISLMFGPQTVTNAAQAGAYLFTRATPSVIYADGQDSALIEVHTTNQGVANVSLKSYKNDEALPLYDDGTHGDRAAGDGIYTIDGVTSNTFPADMWLFQGKAGSIYFDVEITYTDGRTPDLGFGHINVVDPGVRFPTEQVGREDRIAC